MPILVNANGTWREGSVVYVKVGGAWVEADTLYVKQAGAWTTAWQNIVVFTNSSNRTAANIYTLMGSPKSPGNYLFINNAIISGGTSSYALRTGVFPAGSVLTIVNNGTIQGRGGAGGAYNGVGQAGGDALLLDYNCELRNANGYIYGGGGGGGGGQVLSTDSSSTPHYLRAGGGGGAGRNGGAAGSPVSWHISGGQVDQVREPSAGSTTAGGLGGQVRSIVSNYGVWDRLTAGTGGGPGAAGAQSTVASSDAQGGLKPFRYTYAGGAAGRAINRNGKSISITSGNNSTRIVGAIAG